ncbi:uncharacterized protein LOC6496283 [Drosophila ananassae]|nr:uncharacterized protein LOC6496283 [Drosophila ananassae]
MNLQCLFTFSLMYLLLSQIGAQENPNTGNKTHLKIPLKRMFRNLHKGPNQGNGTLHIVIHKVVTGDPYYKVFDGNETAARGFTNKIWNRLLNRYKRMLI